MAWLHARSWLGLDSVGELSVIGWNTAACIRSTGVSTRLATPSSRRRDGGWPLCWPAGRGPCWATGRVGSNVTRSEVEDPFREFLHLAGLPQPKVNEPLRLRGRWIEGDCVWHVQRLVAELDGHATHATAKAYERDRARDRALNAA